MEHKHPETIEMEDIERELDETATGSFSPELAGYMALIEACKMVAELTGSCPGDHELIDMKRYGCDAKRCVGRPVYCWFDYFNKIAT